MDELLRQLFKILRGMWHRRWIGLLVAWVIAIGGVFWVMRIPDRYQASARIYVDTQSIIRPLMAGLAISPNVDQQVALLARTLISRPNIEKLMRSSDMDLLATTAKEKEAMVDQLISGIQLSGGRENMYQIAYRDATPERALRVVQSFLSMFVESGLGDKRKDSEAARRFLNDQIKAYEARMAEAETRLRDYRLANLEMLGANPRDFVAQVANLTEELAKLQTELRVAEQSRDALKQELSGELPSLIPETPVLEARSTTPELDARIEAQRRTLDDLRRRYTDQHPDVIIVNRLIDQLEAQRREERQARAKALKEQVQAGAPNNPVFQRIKVAISEAEGNIAALKARIADVGGKIQRARAAAARGPEMSTELQQMNRDYEILKRNYEQLVTRREQAALGKDVEDAGAGAEFRLIEPPRATPKPVFPDRKAMVFMVLALSVGGGLFASFALAQLFQTVHDARTLREICRRPVLGAVSLLSSPTMLKRRRMLHAAFGSGVAGLLVLYGAWIGWVTWTLSK
jgi:polysaccharide chain length determinant protein (PEP-CTERM system associated)